MLDNKFCSSNQKENICIDTNRVLDSCRDKDCFENVRVFLTDFGEEIIERTSIVRAKCAKIVSAYIDVNDVPFNRGFYQLNIKMYVKISFEACISQGNIQEFEGIAVVEKKVILYGSEGNVNVFKSDKHVSGFCAPTPCEGSCSNNLPTAVLETVDPIILNAKIMEKRHDRPNPCCCCSCDDIPEGVTRNINGTLTEDGCRYLVASIGVFSVIRIVRPSQFIIQATEYTVPDKECLSHSEENPCDIFKCMAFPTHEFTSGAAPMPRPMKHEDIKGCGCK